jgi:hypothetical protein
MGIPRQLGQRNHGDEAADRHDREPPARPGRDSARLPGHAELVGEQPHQGQVGPAHEGHAEGPAGQVDEGDTGSQRGRRRLPPPALHRDGDRGERDDGDVHGQEPDQLTDRAGAIEDCPEFHAGEFEADADPDAPDARLVQLLEQIEDIYRADAEDAHDTSDLIGRLAANLAYARDTFARRLESAEGPEMARFDRYVERLLEARSGTPFGRHLASALRGASPDRGALTKQAS